MRAASMPAFSHRPTASPSIAWPTPTISWLIIFAARPAPTGPMCVQRPATSFISGAMRSRSAASPPAITVNVPASTAGGPPDTGASTQRQPVALKSRAAGLDRNGREIDHQLRRAHYGDQFLQHVLDRFVRRQVEHDDVGALDGLGDRAHARALRDDVVGAYLPADSGQPFHHRPAHQAGADI